MTRLQQGLLAAVGVVLLIVVSLHYVIVRVEERGPDGTSIWIPVPIELAQAALWFVPDIDQRVDVDVSEIGQFSAVVEALLKELEDVEEAELVHVEDGDETVLIHKKGDYFEVAVTTPREKVQVRLAMRTLQGVLASFDEGRFDIAAALGAFKHSSGPMVHVDEPGTEVTLAIW
ncbi:MAG: hypothetical protein O2968_15400 [Acidobacteria bacterium]|nr:hypothetical protein [Acidobacteriota bacterium]